jgi:hypothetical protein
VLLFDEQLTVLGSLGAGVIAIGVVTATTATKRARAKAAVGAANAAALQQEARRISAALPAATATAQVAAQAAAVTAAAEAAGTGETNPCYGNASAPVMSTVLSGLQGASDVEAGSGGVSYCPEKVPLLRRAA